MNPSAVPPKQPDRRKIPSDGFLFLNPSESRTGAGVRHGFFQVPKRCPKRRRSGTYENVGEICRRKLTKCSNSGMFNWAAAEDAEAQADQESSRNPY